MLLAMDPGSAQTGWVLYDGLRPVLHGITPNDTLLEQLRSRYPVIGRSLEVVRYDQAVIEWVAPRGMLASAQLFETLWWAGRFTEAMERHGVSVNRYERSKVKLHICGTTKAKDMNVRQALIDRYGGVDGKAKAVGTKLSPGPLYGVANDIWAALALAIAFTEKET